MSGYGAGTPERDAVPPGWYYDAGTGSQRWWDGTAWTGRHRPAGDGAVPPVEAPPVTYAPARVDLRNQQATAGLVLGIVALVVNPLTVPSIVGVVLSSLGLRRATALLSHGYPPVGRSTAVWGLVLSVLAFLFSASSKFFLF